MLVIKVYQEYVPVSILPKDLELNGTLTKKKRDEPNNRSDYRCNPLKTLHVLCKAYNLKYKMKRRIVVKIRTIRVTIDGFNLDIKTRGESYRKALQKMSFKLHREYHKRIIEYTPIE